MVGRSRRRGAARWAAVQAKPGGDLATLEEDGLEAPPSPGDSSYYQDKVDDFHEARSRAALAKGWSEMESADEEEDGEEEEEEVLALDVADEDEDGESGDAEEDDDGSSVQSETDVDPSLSWGQRKKLYYDTDCGSTSRRKQSQQELEEEEEEEEEEAQLIQKRLTHALQEDDFGITWVEAFAKPVPQEDETKTRVVKDLAKVSAKEKLKMLQKESPELLELIEDLKVKLAEVKDELEPLLQLVEQGTIPSGKGSQYLRTKYSLYLNYCSNISFYLILKARRTPVHGHPVIERLVTYRNLINKLSVADQKLSSEIRHLLTFKDDPEKLQLNLKARSTKMKPRSVSGTGAATTHHSDDSDFDEEAALKHRESSGTVEVAVCGPGSASAPKGGRVLSASGNGLCSSSNLGATGPGRARGRHKHTNTPGPPGGPGRARPGAARRGPREAESGARSGHGRRPLGSRAAGWGPGGSGGEEAAGRHPAPSGGAVPPAGRHPGGAGCPASCEAQAPAPARQEGAAAARADGTGRGGAGRRLPAVSLWRSPGPRARERRRLPEGRSMAETSPPPTAAAESCREESPRGGEQRPEGPRRASAGGAEREGEAGPPPASPAGLSEPDSPVAAPFFLLYPGHGGAGLAARPPPPQRAWRTPPSPGSPLPFLLLSYPAGGGQHHPNYLMANERMNLMNMAKLSIKGLIESALNLGRTLDSDYAPLQQFFVVMEHCLKHGLKAKKTFLGQNKSFWGPLELVEKLVPEAAEITASVKDLPGLKTPVGRGRAWLRLALMQKKLSEYMKALINKKELLSEFYEPNALMMEEEGAIIAGLLVGLNVIDANFCMKGEDLDSQVGVIDFSMYLKDGNSSKGSEGDGQITAILDQKNYVEELNRHLNATVNNLQAKVDALEKSNTKLTEELAVANNRIITLQEEMERVKEESSYILESNRKGPKQDRTSEGQALSEARKHLKEETQLRLDVEKELEIQISMRQEMELAMKMLEKDVCEKQDALVSLRQQLDDLRALKHELAFKLQSSDLGVKQKSELNSRLEEKTNQMAATIKQLEQRLRQAERGRQSAELDNRLFKQDFGDKINSLQLDVEELTRQRNQLELELKQERERRLQNRSITGKGSQKPEPKMDGKHRIQEENVKLKKPPEENHRLQSHPADEQDQRMPSEKPQMCQLCQDRGCLMQNVCKNCKGTFCDACSINELPLPSSIKPERVCNPCHKHLMEQYSTSPA